MNTIISSRVAYSIVGVGVVLVLGLVYLLGIQQESVPTNLQGDMTQSTALTKVNAYTSEYYGFTFAKGTASRLPQDFVCDAKAPKYLFETREEQYTYCQNSGDPIKVSLAWKRAGLQKSAYLERIANTVARDKNKQNGTYRCIEDKTYPTENGISGAISDCTISFPDGTTYYASAYFFYPSQYAEVSQILYAYSGKDAPSAESVNQAVRDIAREVVMKEMAMNTVSSHESFFASLLGITVYAQDAGGDAGAGDGGGDAAGDCGIGDGGAAAGDCSGDAGSSGGDGGFGDSGSTPVSGAYCSPTHYGCVTGSATNQLDNATSWTWMCPGSFWDDPAQSCFEKKAINEPVGAFTYIDGTWSGTGVMGGWACDADNYATALAVQFYEGSTLVASGLANSSWDAGMPSTACGGNKSHTFWVPLPDALKTGTNRTVTAYAMNIGPTGLINTNLGNQTINVALPPITSEPTESETCVIKVTYPPFGDMLDSGQCNFLPSCSSIDGDTVPYPYTANDCVTSCNGCGALSTKVPICSIAYVSCSLPIETTPTDIPTDIPEDIPTGDSTLSPHTIYSSAGAGGTISPLGNTIVNPIPGTPGYTFYDEDECYWGCPVAQIPPTGGSQTYTITSNSGYVISDVSVDGESQGSINEYTFSNVIADHTITATFVENTGDPEIPTDTGTPGDPGDPGDTGTPGDPGDTGTPGDPASTDPTISAERPFVRTTDPGNNVTLHYTTGTASPDMCQVTSGSGYSSGPLTLTVGTLYTRITAQTTFTINCSGLTDSVTVKIQSTTVEI